MKFSENFMSRY